MHSNSKDSFIHSFKAQGELFKKGRQVKTCESVGPFSVWFLHHSPKSFSLIYFLISVSLLMEMLIYYFPARVSLSSKGNMCASFPHSFFQVILPDLLTPLPDLVPTDSPDCKTAAGGVGRSHSPTSRRATWKIFRNIHQALFPVITT